MRVLNGPFHNCSTSRYVIIKSKALIIHLLNSHLINLSNYIYLGNYNVVCSLCFTMNSMINYIMSKNEQFKCILSHPDLIFYSAKTCFLVLKRRTDFLYCHS